MGDSLLDVVVKNNVDIDGFGACDGTLTCSTCHLILRPKEFELASNPPEEDEKDMLDLAHDLSPTSRLGCQVNLTKEMDGIEVTIPTTVNDLRNA